MLLLFLSVLLQCNGEISTASLGVLREVATTAWDSRLGLEPCSSWVLRILGLLAPLLLAWNSRRSSPLPSELPSSANSTKLPAGGLPLLLLLLAAPLLEPLLLGWSPWVEPPLLAPSGFLNFLGCRNAKCH